MMEILEIASKTIENIGKFYLLYMHLMLSLHNR